MTLTLDQVRQTRFHLARRNGYEPVDVDNFVDKVEVTLAQLGEENDSLKKQVDALTVGGDDAAPATAAAAGADPAEVETLQRQLNESHAEVERLRGELAGKSEELAGVQSELESARGALSEGDQGELVAKLQAELGAARNDLDQARSEVAARDEKLTALTAELEGAKAAQAERTSKVEHIVVTAAPDAAPAVTKLLQMATEQAERLVGEAETDAEKLRSDAQADAERVTAEASSKADAAVEEASAKAHEALSGARTRAEDIETQARAAADELTGAAQAKSEELHAEIGARRTELVSALESERDELRGKVHQLRSFEDRYRQSLTSQLQAHLDSLSGRAEPEDTPDALDESAQPSATPRLDALLND